MVTGEARRVAGPVGLFLLVLALVLAPLAPASAAPGDPGTITGTVYDPDFVEASGATVTLYNAAKVAVGSPQVTGADGTYEFGGLDGTYYVGATKAGVGTVFYDGAGTIANADAIAVDPDFGEFVDLQLIPPPVIAGTVSNAGGPIDGADVTAYEYDAIDDFWSAADFASTDAAGHYAFTGLAPKAYRLRFSAPGSVSEYWNDKASLSTADDVTVVAGAVQQANAVLASLTAVSGPGHRDGRRQRRERQRDRGAAGDRRVRGHLLGRGRLRLQRSGRDVHAAGACRAHPHLVRSDGLPRRSTTTTSSTPLTRSWSRWRSPRSRTSTPRSRSGAGSPESSATPAAPRSRARR